MDYESEFEFQDFLNGISLCDLGDLEIDYGHVQDPTCERTKPNICEPTVSASPTVTFTSTVLVGDTIDVEDTTDTKTAQTIKIEQASRPKRVAAVRAAGRFKVRNSHTPRRPRDRRRNKEQRERENEKRRLKQDEYQNKRKFCFEREAFLRNEIYEVIEHFAEQSGLTIEKVIPHLPAELLEIMRRADDALERYRDFTGKKHNLMKLNSFQVWPPIDRSDVYAGLSKLLVGSDDEEL